MIENTNIKVILFDSGRVLNSPRTGHWFIPPNFYTFVDRKKFDGIDINYIEKAFSKGMEYLDDNPLILTEEEEFNHFVEFYRIFSNKLPVLKLSQDDIVGIAKDTVYNDEKFHFHDDVFEVIPLLSQRYKLGVVSDTWPSLDRVFRNVGLRDYFSSFVMSSILGVVKPNEKMFNTALSELNIRSEEALFIDDNIKNVEGASKLGINSILMLRNENRKVDTEYPCINNLGDLYDILNRKLNFA